METVIVRNVSDWDESGLLEFSTLLHSRPGPAKECREDCRRGIERDIMNRERNAREGTVKYLREKSLMRRVKQRSLRANIIKN